jgi:hypothetical protein
MKPTVFPINLFPNGDCGDKAITLTPSILILGNARLRYKYIPFAFTKLPLLVPAILKGQFYQDCFCNHFRSL